MKTVALVCNSLLLGMICFGLITDGLPSETGQLLLVLLGIVGIIMNILLIAGTRIGKFEALAEDLPFSGTTRKKVPLIFFLKSFTIILDLMILVIFFTDFRNGSGYLFPFIFSFLVLTPLLSIVRISIGKWNRFDGLKRTALITGITLVVLVGGTFTTFRILIGKGIKENISIAKKEFPGKAEDALLAFLADSTKSPRERTEIAVWTLGQIRSEKALPVLNSLYKKSEYSSGFSRYEIHKAIVSIENDWLGAKEKNIFGSWTKLNK